MSQPTDMTMLIFPTLFKKMHPSTGLTPTPPTSKGLATRYGGKIGKLSVDLAVIRDPAGEKQKLQSILDHSQA